MAILAGDLMMGLAFQLLSDKAPNTALAYAVTLELSRATNAMIGGQVYDTLGGFAAGLSDEQRLAMVAKGLVMTPVRYAMIVADTITIARFAGDLWITGNRKWRK